MGTSHEDNFNLFETLTAQGLDIGLVVGVIRHNFSSDVILVFPFLSSHQKKSVKHYVVLEDRFNCVRNLK